MIRILIADDHAIVRRGIREILSLENDIEVVGEAGSSQEAMNLAVRIHPDVILLDVTMPGRGGLEVLKELKQRGAHARVLILSMHPEDQLAVRSLKAGAAGYMTKESAPEVLVDAIRKIHSGGRYVSSELAEKLAFYLESGSDQQPHDRLSDREYQVLCMLAAGRTVTEIAEELSLSVKTISTYRTRVLEKLKLTNTAELIHYALQNQLKI